MKSSTEISCELMIIGAGMTGMAASLFAAEKKIDVVQAGLTGGLNFASGLLDLMAVHPISEGKVWKNPWEAIKALRRDLPDHPYAFIDDADMREAFRILLSFLSHAGLGYHCEREKNIEVITPTGTVKPTYCVPRTMAEGSAALAKKIPTLIVDFHGLKGFSGTQIVQTLKSRWPRLRAYRVAFPEAKGELYAEQIARMLEIPENRKKLAEQIKPLTEKAQSVGVPAVLGIYGNEDVFEDLQEQIGRPLFEIPTMPPSITGMRLLEKFREHLPSMGVRMFNQHGVEGLEVDQNGDFIFKVGRLENRYTIRAKGAILATGRFFGGGLREGQKKIRESIFDLPVYQDEDREKWRRKNFFDPRGHRLNKYGLEFDEKFRPVDKKRRAAYKNLYAAGSILAHQDWIRMKCGSGLAITTAFAGIKAFSKWIKNRRGNVSG